LLTLLLFCVMWRIHKTRNSAKDCSLFSIASPVQGNRDLHQPFRNLMLFMSTSWSKFQSVFSCLLNSFFHMIWVTGMPELVGMFPCVVA